MKNINRRLFLKATGLSGIPLLAPAIPLSTMASEQTSDLKEDNRLYFFFDGIFLRPTEYLTRLQALNQSKEIQSDQYGRGGAVEELEKKFAAITGKEAAVFMPSGTMANQFAIAVLSGSNSKVFVQETSHVFRDEADAAQSVFGKRLIPLAQGKAHFTLDELQQSVEYHNKGEVFKSGIGAVSVENPVRRSDGRFVPLEELKKISGWCREQGFKLHLDGARIYMASAWTGIPISDYASLFDTVYISLYKYFGAAAGAVLCGDKAVIDQMHHLIKIHGGGMYQNWANAAMALYTLEGFEIRLQQTIKKAKGLFTQLNQLPELKVVPLQNGTNIYAVELDSTVNSSKLSAHLREKYNIFLPLRGADGTVKITINETLLRIDNSQVTAAFKDAIKIAKS